MEAQADSEGHEKRRIRQPHDALARRILSRPQVAGDYLRSVLPESLIRNLDLGRLEVLPGNYHDPNLSARQSDFLYSVPIPGAGAQRALLYVLLEQQSTVDPRMAARLYVYTARVLERWCVEHPQAKRVPAIVPLVIYNGRGRWTASTSLRELCGLPVSLAYGARRLLPELRYWVDDLRRTTDAALERRPASRVARITLVLLRHGTDRTTEFLEFLRTQAGMLNDVEDRNDLLAFLTYILNVASQDPDLVLETLADALEPKTREVAVTAAEQLLARGRERGREEGRLEGERSVLLRLLRRRFTTTPALESRVAAANGAELARWTDRVLDAATLDEIFEPEA